MSYIRYLTVDCKKKSLLEMSREKKGKRGMNRKKASCPKQRYMTDRLIGTKSIQGFSLARTTKGASVKLLLLNSVVPNSRTDTLGTIDKKLISGVSIGVSLSRSTRVEIIMVSCIGVACTGNPQSRGWREREGDREIGRKRLSPPPWQWQMDGDFNQWMESPLANRVFLLPHHRSAVASYVCMYARPHVLKIYTRTHLNLSR